MPWDDLLTGRALTIASTASSPLRVMAGPGTGKSFAMTRRVARWLEVEAVPPERILAVTFTRTAGELLRGDLSALGTPGCDRVRAGTLHSFCFGLLNQNQVFHHTGRSPRPLVTLKPKKKVMQFEGKPLIFDLQRSNRAFGAGKAITKRILAFEADWARLQDEVPGWPTLAVDQAFQRTLLAWLKFHGGILIGELVPLALRYLRGNPTAPALLAQDHVVVDEYQDLNKAEQTLVGLLAEGGSLSIVGDEDQSIYSFRHANPEGIVDFPATQDETLDECRRCPSGVVALADSLIRMNHAAGALPRLRVLPGNPPGEIHLVQWQTLDEQTAGLGRYVEHLLTPGGGGYSPGDILVLSPSRLIGYAIRDTVLAAGTPVHSYYYEEALESESAKESFTLLRLLTTREDRISLRYWLGIGSSDFRAVEYARLRALCEQTGDSPRQAMDRMVAGTVAPTGMQDILERYRELLHRLAILEALPPRGVVDELFPAGVESVRMLREAAEEIDFDDVAVTVSTILEAALAQVTQPDVPNAPSFVRVMSLHKSKGLTAPVVIVAGAVNGLTPHYDRDLVAPADIERHLREQRRLFYVAVTRCTRVLAISTMAQVSTALAHRLGLPMPPGRRGATINTRTSDFVAEMGPTTPRMVLGRVWALGGYR